MPDENRTAKINFILNGTWTNGHQNVSGPYERYYTIAGLEAPDETTIIKDMRAGMAALKEVFRDAVSAGKQLRIIGGTWSLSDAAYTKGWLLKTETLNNYFKLKDNHVLTPGYKGDLAGLYLVQCNLSVKKLNYNLEYFGRALKTSGASNGQTIAGAVATGTHGSAFQYGAMPEFVVGIHLITGPDESIWLERSSYPVITDEFAARLGVTIKRRDDLFNAALVSFGGFGIVAALLIETEEKYLLETKTFRIDTDDKLKTAMSTMDLAPLQLNPVNELPWHFEVTFNPHDPARGYAKTMYKRECPEGFRNPPPSGDQLAPGEGLLGVIGRITENLPGMLVSKIIGALMKSTLKITDPGDPPLLMTPGGTFSSTTTKGKAYSMELGIDMADAGRVLDLLLSLTPEIKTYAGVISFRWVRKSSAMLGFTRFDTTTTIEFNAAANEKTLAYYRRIWDELEANGIPYTLHWGQMNNFTPERVKQMYSPAVVAQWSACRDELMSPEARAVFSSDFMKNTGLG